MVDSASFAVDYTLKLGVEWFCLDIYNNQTTLFEWGVSEPINIGATIPRCSRSGKSLGLIGRAL